MIFGGISGGIWNAKLDVERSLLERGQHSKKRICLTPAAVSDAGVIRHALAQASAGKRSRAHCALER